MFRRGDFHIHTNISDGELTPGAVVLLAMERNIDVIAITDHNRVSGNKEAIEIGNMFKVKVIPGIELSTRFKGNKIHILGYFRGDEYSSVLFNKSLYNINKGQFKLCNKEFNGELNLKYEGGKLTTKSGIDFLHYFNAKVVLAHPVFLNKNILFRLLQYNFDGIEAKYYRNTLKDTEYFINIAKENNIIYTAGSDFHLLNKVDLKHGTLGEVYLDKYEMNFLYNWLGIE